MELLHPNRIQAKQDLLRNDPLGSNEHRDPAFLKRIVLDVAGAITALASGLVLSLYFRDSVGLVPLIIALGIYVIVAFFGALLGGPRLQRGVSIFVQAVALLVWLPVVSVLLTS